MCQPECSRSRALIASQCPSFVVFRELQFLSQAIGGGRANAAKLRVCGNFGGNNSSGYLLVSQATKEFRCRGGEKVGFSHSGNEGCGFTSADKFFSQSFSTTVRRHGNGTQKASRTRPVQTSDADKLPAFRFGKMEIGDGFCGQVRSGQLASREYANDGRQVIRPGVSNHDPVTHENLLGMCSFQKWRKGAERPFLLTAVWQAVSPVHP